MKADETHEDYSRDDAIGPPSDRQFGFVFAVVFAVIGAWPMLGGGPIRWWSLILAAVFLTVALAIPHCLAPLNRLWLWIGLLMHKVVSPVVLGLVFFSTVTPIGLLIRALGKDPLRLRFDPEAPTYWIERRPPGPPGHSMRNQF
jgi:Saxitoxin biosynthesis operon protein SxtJ